MTTDSRIDLRTRVGMFGVLAGFPAIGLSLSKPPVWIWVFILLFLFLSCLAMLKQGTAQGRIDLADALNAKNYTRFYCAVSQRVVGYFWPRYCTDIDDGASLFRTFRAALGWRLYDRALQLAVAYPMLFLLGFWIFSVPAGDGKLGNLVVLPATDFWPERAATFGIIALVLIAPLLEKWAAVSPKVFLRKVSGWLPLIAFAFAFAVTLAFAFAFAVTLAVAFASVGAGAVAVAAAVAFAGAVAVEFAVEVAFPGAGAFAAIAAGVAIAAGAVAVAVAVAVEFLDGRGQARQARWLVSVLIPIGWIILLQHLNWQEASETGRAFFVFLGVFPLINGVFDFLSYGVTLTLLRRGLGARLPLLLGFVDLIIAMILFLALGATLTVMIAGMNQLAGVPLVDLGALFAGVRDNPSEHRWVFFMLFSTILPTALHFGVSLLGAQGASPRWLRGKVAGWVQAVPESPAQAALVPFAVGAIWAWPFMILFGIGAGIWWLGQGLLIWLTSQYFAGLLWLAQGFGAF